ncbi:MAG: hypothetical protein IJQ95_02330 [Paludibacteraceae bacterium]|nr:hypothetical protein [Paludibacteraceae bacterium]
MAHKKSQILLIIGLIVLLAGAVLTFTPWKEYANYVLVAGLLIIVIRGSFRIREKEDEQKNQANKDEITE